MVLTMKVSSKEQLLQWLEQIENNHPNTKKEMYYLKEWIKRQ
jgi:hypothetical protein